MTSALTTCQTCYGSTQCPDCEGSGLSTSSDPVPAKVRSVRSAVDAVERLFRTDPMVSLSFAEAQDLKHSIERLERILKDH